MFVVHGGEAVGLHGAAGRVAMLRVRREAVVRSLIQIGSKECIPNGGIFSWMRSENVGVPVSKLEEEANPWTEGEDFEVFSVPQVTGGRCLQEETIVGDGIRVREQRLRGYAPGTLIGNCVNSIGAWPEDVNPIAGKVCPQREEIETTANESAVRAGVRTEGEDLECPSGEPNAKNICRSNHPHGIWVIRPEKDLKVAGEH